MNNYWFRPKRIGKWVAAYHPSSWQGWVLTIILFVLGFVMFRFIDLRSHSASDTIINFLPWAIIIALLFDLVCFRKGEYPWWWEKHGK